MENFYLVHLLCLDCCLSFFSSSSPTECPHPGQKNLMKQLWFKKKKQQILIMIAKTIITKTSVFNNNNPSRVLATEQPISTCVKRENMTSCRFCRGNQSPFVTPSSQGAIGIMFTNHSPLGRAVVGSSYFIHNVIHGSKESIKLILKSSTFSNQYFPDVQYNKTIE